MSSNYSAKLQSIQERYTDQLVSQRPLDSSLLETRRASVAYDTFGNASCRISCSSGLISVTSYSYHSAESLAHVKKAVINQDMFVAVFDTSSTIKFL